MLALPNKIDRFAGSKNIRSRLQRQEERQHPDSDRRLFVKVLDKEFVNEQPRVIRLKLFGRGNVRHNLSPIAVSRAVPLCLDMIAHVPRHPTLHAGESGSSLVRRPYIGSSNRPMAAALFDRTGQGNNRLPSSPELFPAANNCSSSGARDTPFLHSVGASAPDVATEGKPPKVLNTAPKAFLPEFKALRPSVAIHIFHHSMAPYGQVKLGFPQNWKPAIPSKKDKITGEACQ